jgi:competence protein ComEC
VLDVGHGLAVLVRTRARSLLFDAGARYPSGFDSGEEIVLPALRSLGIKTLDAIVISHADNDHAGGLGAVLEAFPRATLIAGPDLQMRQAISCRRGQRWEWDGVLFEIAHPSAAFPLLGNDSSCVLKVSTADHALLLTGDVERAAERSLVAAGLDLTADVVVVPHHGSATSSTGAFWARVGATTVVTGEAGAVSLTFAPDDRFEMSTGRARRHRAWRMDTD